MRALLLLAMTAAASAAQFDLPRKTFLIDEVVPIVVSGLPPGAKVTIALRGGRAEEWSSQAVYVADAQGVVDVAHSADPMFLFWSARRDRADRLPLPEWWQLTATVDGAVVARETIERRAVAANVSVTPVHERGLAGDFYRPAGEGKHAALLVLSGSGGGVPPAGGPAGGLASHGYAVLALAYFGAERLPSTLSRIPLEYFRTALDWLATQPSVDPTRIGVVGASRGGELALILGALYPDIRLVVGYVPSDEVWPGCCSGRGEPAWTLGGRPLMPRAPIPVEHIRGAVLLISGQDDGVWHSTEMADRVMARLRRFQFAYPYRHLAYAGAGHAIGRPYTPTTDLDELRHPLTGRLMHMGGTAEGTARAREDSWRQMLAFVDEHLR